MKGTTRKAETLTEQDLKDSELRYRRLFESAQDGILILDAETSMIDDVNPYLIKMLGYSREEFIKKKLWEVGAFKDIDASQEAFGALQENEYIRYEDLPLKTKDGQLIQVEFVSNVYLVGGKKVIQCNVRDISDHRRIVKALQGNEKTYHDLINQSPDGFFIIESSGNILTVNKAMCRELEFSEEELLSMNIWDIIPEQYLDQYTERLTKILEGKSLMEESAEYTVHGKDGKVHCIEVLSAPHYSDKEIIGFQGVARDITARKQAEEALRESESKFRSYIENAPLGLFIADRLGRYLEVNKMAHEMLGYTMSELLHLSIPDILAPQSLEAGLQQFQKVVQDGFATAEFLFRHKDGSQFWATVLAMKLSEDRFMSYCEDITEHKQAEERIKRQLARLTALSSIDRTIAASLDLKFNLSEILTHVTAELGIDAASILILNPSSQMLEFGAEHGFRTKAVKGANVRLGESYAGRAALERLLVQIPDLKDEPDNLLLSTLLNGEDFVCYYGLPLIAKGKVIGVLEVFHRAALEPDAEWFDFFYVLAGQTAIAIENISLFNDLQRSNSELVLAYETTLEGWSQALDLRDKETEGHTLRVTEMAVSLARDFGLSEGELVNVRRGALLHDIGKMGVPDHILLKPGELTEQEWNRMRMHPVYAYDLLSNIAYLHEALNIPHYHHEKWDGSGYPDGLKGEQTPLVARIFAVVDVWDALTSDRPYRPAWTKEKAREYIRTSSGTHFDPQVVDVFMQMLDQI